MALGDTDNRLTIVVVCTGNICRSPMGAIILQDRLEEEGLDDRVAVSSCGLGGWHVGQGADERAVAELQRSGHDGRQHRARQVSDRDLAADLLLAMDSGHRDALISKGADPQKVRLFRSFDPQAPANASVDDPYYGSPEDFARSRQDIEGALDGLVEWVRDALK